MKKGYTLVETLAVIALVAILAGIMFETGKAATNKALEFKAMHSTLMQKAQEEAYKLLSNNETQEQTYELEDSNYTVHVQSCGNGFELELYQSDLEFDEDTENCDKSNLVEIASFDACQTFKPKIKTVCKI